MKKVIFGLFFLYCMLLAEILLFARTPETAVPVRDYFLLYANILPFETLIRYTSFFIKHRDIDSFLLFSSNVGGNFLLFMPMGFFLPVLFKNMRKVRFCFSVIFFTVFSVELLQGFFRVGILDIDDLAVNLAGARVGFGFFKATRKDDYVFLS